MPPKTGIDRSLYRKRYKSGQRVTAAFAGRLAKLNLVRSSKKLLRQGRGAKDPCLWIGELPPWYLQGWWAELYTLWHGNPPVTPLPLANLSIRVVGAARSGKTTSAINPLMRSAILQKLPFCLYEYKADERGQGGQMDFLMPYALKHGYRPYVFAPGRDYSDVFNPLDMLRDHEDAAMARTLAKTLIENTEGEGSSSDGFFGPAGENVVEGAIRLAKYSCYKHLPMAYTLIKLPKLAERLLWAVERQTLPELLTVPFTQIMQNAKSERTLGSILSGASNALMTFMQRDLLLSMMGTTTLIADKLRQKAERGLSIRAGEEYRELILGPGEAVFFQSDISRETAINPLLASLLAMMTNLNCSEQRQDPFVLCLDENSTLIMSQQANWPNLHRSKKLVIISGYQNAAQMREALSPERFQYLESGMQIGFFFRPSHAATARDIAELFGKREAVVESRSVSRSFGYGSGGSRSANFQLKDEPLIEADRLNNFGSGECILVHPACGTNRDGWGMPWYLSQVDVGRQYFQEETHCQQLWQEKVFPRAIARQKQRQGLDNIDRAAVERWMEAREMPLRDNRDLEEGAKSMWIEAQLLLCREEAERLLPLPKKEDESRAEQKQTVDASVIGSSIPPDERQY